MPDGHIILSFVIYCAIVSVSEVFAERSARIVVQVNNKIVNDRDILDGKVICNVGDIINFSCDGPYINYDKHFGVVYEKDENRFKIPKDGSYETNLFEYSVKVHEFDDKTKVHCEVEIWNKNNKEYTFFSASIPVTLVVNNDNNLSESISDVYYSETNPVTHICSGLGNRLIIMTNGIQRNYKERKFVLAPTDSGSVVFCSEILTNRKGINIENGKIFYERTIYNQKKYTYTGELIENRGDDNLLLHYRNETKTSTWSHNDTISSTQIGIIVGVVFIICSVLVAVYVLYKTKRTRPTDVTPSSNQDANNDGCSTELIYAELALSQAPASCSMAQDEKESPYAEITGFIARKHQNESPYAEVIFARK